MRWFFEVALIGITSVWKWLLASVVVVGALVGILFAFGVLGGGGNVDVLIAPVASPTPTSAAPTTQVPTSTPASQPTAIPASKMVSVPILATQARNVGSLEFVLVYDPLMLEFAQVEAGLLAGNAIIDSGLSRPGRIWAAIIDAQGINGSGTVAVVQFNLRDQSSGTLPLTLESIAAFDANTLVDIITTTTPGQFNGAGLSLLSPIVTFQ